MRLILLLLSVFTTLTFTYSQRSVLGDITINITDDFVNTYTEVTSDISVGNTSITVANNQMTGGAFSGSLAAGDLVMIIQMQGASMDINTTPTTSWGGNYTVPDYYFGGTFPDQFGQNEHFWGQITNLNNSGNFETIEVESVSGLNTINFNCGVTKNYTASGHVQLVRVPRYANLTVSNGASISAPLWDGTTGGVVAIEVELDLTLTATGSINSDGKGFRGGLSADDVTGNGTASDNGYLGSNLNNEGAEKGESIGGFYTEYDNLESRYCRGAPANGGGAGNYHNAGGGGGANVGVGTYTGKGNPVAGYNNAWNAESAGFASSTSSGGGRGGYSYSISNQNANTVGNNNAAWNGDERRNAGGYGGHPITYDANKIFAGGGGGAGEQNNSQGGNGGRGGGIVFLQVYGDINGAGAITANGENGENSEGANFNGVNTSSKSGNDGSGGAGGGGTVYISNGGNLPATININVNGGVGGNQVLSLGNFASNEADGPGGGGAGGLISISSGTPALSVAGGGNGVTNSSHLTEFPPNGATVGASGKSDGVSPYYNLSASDEAICGGGSTDLTAVLTGTMPAGGTINWYDQQFGGTVLGTGTTYNTGAIATNTTFYVGVCPGTFRIPVEVTVSPDIIISGTALIADETCNGNDGGITGLTASGGTAPLTFDYNGTTSASEDLTNATGGNYTLTVTDDNGCTETSGPYTIGASPGPSIDVTNISISDETCNGNDGEITGITATGTGITYTWNGTASATLDHSNLTAGNYTLVVTDNVGCTTSSGPHVVGTQSGPTVDATGIVIVPENCGNSDGSITGITSSGTGLTYEWNGSASTDEDNVNISTGDYTLVITDANGCTVSSGPHNVSENTGPTIDETGISISGESCNGNDGSITGITSAGTGLSFEWNGNASPSEDITNSTAGNYTLTVTDGNGCTETSGPHNIPTITPVSIDATNVNIVDETCDGNDGSITGLTIVNGVGVTMTWDGNIVASQDLLNIPAGTYTFAVVDANGCTATYGPVNVGGANPPDIDATGLVTSNTACTGNTGSISGLTVSGGTGTVTTTWSSGQSTNDISNLAAGDYTFYAEDTQNCIDSIEVTINMDNAPVIDISAVVVTDENCNQADGSITGVTVSGGTPAYTYNWNSNPVQTTLDATNLAPDTYTLTVTDASGCTDTEDVTVGTLNGPTVDATGLVITDDNCGEGNGAINGLVVNGVNPIVYAWDNTSSTTIDINGLFAGNYTLTITDGNGCTIDYGPTVVNSTPVPNADFTFSPSEPEPNDLVSFTDQSSGGTIVSWEWLIDGTTDNNQDTDYTFITEGDYLVSLAVENANGCTDTVVKTITVLSNMVIPNVITINGDGSNEMFVIKGLKSNTELTLFNRWGETVFETKDYQNDWAGKDRSGKELTAGVYSYVITNSVGEVFHGFVHLIK